jgi:hypothetical protein
VTPDEAARLLAACAAFDNRQPSEMAKRAWASALNDVPLDQDCFDAVAAYYGTPPQDPNQRLWIQPHNVRTLRTRIRNQRLENFQYEPIAQETTAQFLARYRGQVHAIASGRIPAPTSRPALEGGPHQKVVQELEDRGWNIGRNVPNSDAEAVIETVRRAGPLGVRCPTCDAAIGRPCKTPGGSGKQPLGKPRLRPHSARLRAASGKPELTAEQRAADEERRREASRQALARHQANPTT